MTIEYKDSKRIVATSKTHTVHTFTSTGTLTVTGSGDIEYLVVAGGGGGGWNAAGGGGAGGMKTDTLSSSAGNKTITVGNGGSAGVSGSRNGGTGADSVFDSITSTGGGGGRGDENSTSGINGGSGGGGCGLKDASNGTGISGQGNHGAANRVNTASNDGGGGGGGKGAVGTLSSGVTQGGNGGIGLQSSINGTATYYAGGGGGATGVTSSAGNSGNGGTGGGGKGAYWNGGSSIAPVAGTANTGGGGGGGEWDSHTYQNGAAGGSGIVIIRYAVDSGITATGGTITTIDTVKPTNVQDNSILVEKDTAKRFWFAENKISTTGLKAYYNFDSIGGGTTLTNQSTTGDGLGSSADGVNTSVTLDTTNEKLGTGCYDFNGSSSKVVLGSASVWSFLSSATANTWSIVWWMKYDDTLTSGHTIMSTTDGATQTDGMFIDNSGSGTIRLIQVDGNNGSWSSAIPDNTSWHHYAITWNAGTVTLYVDNISKGTQSQTAGSGTPQYGLNLGVNNDEYYTELTLDDMSIWSRVLTTSEISALYNSGSGSIVSEAKDATWTQFGMNLIGLITGGYSTVEVNTVELFDGVSFYAGGQLLEARYNHFGGGDSSDALVGGGSTTAIYGASRTTESFNGTSWSSESLLNTGRHTLGGDGNSTDGICFQGLIGGSDQSITEEYNGTSWSTGGSANARRSVGGGGSSTDAITFGGYNGGNQANTQEYNGTAWSNGGSLASGTRELQGGGNSSHGVSIGGTASSVVTTCATYNGSSWTSTGSLNTAQADQAGDGDETTAFSAGGSQGSKNNVESYNGTAWTDLTVLSTGRTQLKGGLKVS